MTQPIGGDHGPPRPGAEPGGVSSLRPRPLIGARPQELEEVRRWGGVRDLHLVDRDVLRWRGLLLPVGTRGLGHGAMGEGGWEGYRGTGRSQGSWGVPWGHGGSPCWGKLGGLP